MMYCNVDEAYNFQSRKNNNKNNMILPSSFDTYNEIDIQNHFNNNINNNTIPAYFTTQGNYNNDTYQGTSINDLINKNQVLDDSDSSSFFDSEVYNVKNKKNKNKKVDMSHEYCINKVMGDLIYDNSSLISSQNKSENNEVYKHARSCKYCKNKINEKIKSYYCNNNINEKIQIMEIKQDKNLNEYFSIESFGYSLKELLIIILAGIILIFILDLLVKIGRKMSS